MRFKRYNLAVASHRFAIIDQHTHAAVGRMQYSAGKQNVVLIPTVLWSRISF